MKLISRLSIVSGVVAVLFVLEYLPEPYRISAGYRIISEAQAVAGHQRRTRRRGAAVGYQAGKTTGASQQAATEQQEEGSQKAEQTEAASAAEPAQAADEKLPLGTVASSLPSGCETVVSKEIQYSKCGPNYYRAVFQGNELVYVTADPDAA